MTKELSVDTLDAGEVPSSGQTLLSVNQISRSFPGVRALNDVSLDVAAGEVHGVVGENGAGKSTLMAIISGALAPNDGSVTISGVRLDQAKPEVARDLGVAIVRQEPALMPDLSVAENLFLAMPPALRPPAHSLSSWAHAVLKLWGEDLSVRPEDRVERLNPQQRFVVEICRAFAQNPKVIILDEPTEHLVGHEVSILFGLIKKHVSGNGAVIYISHRIPEVKQISDRISILRNGEARGTFDASTLSEEEVVQLIIGRQLDVYFPDKYDGRSIDGAGMRLQGFSSRHVAEVDLSFQPGEIIGLAGIEGNGQEQFLRAIAGLEKSSGRVEVAGISTETHGLRSAARQRIAFLSGDRHNEGVLTGLDVGANITFRNLERRGPFSWVGPKFARDIGTRVVRGFNVKTPSLETPIESLSGGNQQKALIGSVLIEKPNVVLIHEPTQGVDVGARREIYDVIRDAANQGAVVVVLSSSALELSGLADRVLVFSRGKVVREIDGDDVTEEAITGTALRSSTERKRSDTSDRRVVSWLASDSAPVLVVAALIALLSVFGFVSNSAFLGEQNTFGVLMLAAPLALVACGQLFVLLTGGIDLSVGPLMGLVTIIGSYYLIDGSPLVSQASGWLIILAVAMGLGVLNWALIDLVKLSPIIATLATYMAVQAVSFMLRPTPGGSISDAVTSPMRASIGPIPVVFVVVVVAIVGLHFLLTRTRGGIALRGVGSRAESARVNGIQVRFTRLVAYVSSALLAGMAGVLFMSQTGTGDASVGESFTLVSITAAVLGGASVFGGRGSFLGVLAGALLVQVVNSLAVFLQLTPDWQFYLVGMMTIGAVALFSVARRRVAVRA